MSRAPTIAVIGAGGLGLVLAAALHEAGCEVTLCVRSKPDSIRVDSTPRARSATIDLTVVGDPAGCVPVDLVLLATKATDTPGTAPWFEHLVGPDTTVVVVQNGLDHVARLSGMVAPEQVLPAVAYISAERVAPGHAVHAIGELLIVPAGSRGATVAEAFAAASIELRQDPDFGTVAWRKLLGNVAANPITALTLRRMDVFGDPDVRALAVGLLTEAVEVGVADGARLSTSHIDDVLAMHDSMPAGSGSSMLYDRLAERRLEHEYITGAVVARAQQHGIDVPLNRAILALLRGLDGRGGH